MVVHRHTYENTRATTHALASGDVGRGEALRDGTCFGMDLRVVDRYFGAHGHTDRFAQLTAEQICRNGCPVRLACLAQAIAAPGPLALHEHVRGGESPTSLAVLRWRHRQERIPAARLAARRVGGQLPPFRGEYGHERRMRRGDFHAHLPLLDLAEDAS